MREGLTRLAISHPRTAPFGFGVRATDAALWPALVFVAFCVPLFIGLGNRDLRGDEAGHSFSVDLILEDGEWLVPKSSPSPDIAFLEKPPLKFWIVAAGILAGLPHDEFGLRFWDPVFGSLAFLYVFAVGRHLGGPLCGAVAVLTLFINRDLLFEHGLRDNAMEAPLLLTYCGGIFHYFRWMSVETGRSRWLHATSVGLYFALGFMVKFVAALFLPFVLGLGTLLIGSYRARFLRHWRPWLGAVAVAVVLIAPWFVYATYLFGVGFWRDIFGAHVYTRLTSYLDPAHLRPWHHYLSETYISLVYGNVFWLVAAGAVLLVVNTIRRRWPEGLLVIMWYAVPVTIISFGTSKLFHYAYPFLPPVGLAAGYLVSRIWAFLRTQADRLMDAERIFGELARWRPGTASMLRRPAVRRVLLALAAVAAGVLVWTFFFGPIRFQLAGVTFRNRHLLRPALFAVLLLILAGKTQLAGRSIVAVLIFAILPTPAYRTTLQALQRGERVFGPARDCVAQVGSRPKLAVSGRRGMYVDEDGLPFNHEFPYYFRSIAPWIRRADTPPQRLHRFLTDPAQQRPVLISSSRYHAVLREFAAASGTHPSLARVPLHGDALLVLPGPYSLCDPDHPLSGRRRMR